MARSKDGNPSSTFRKFKPGEKRKLNQKAKRRTRRNVERVLAKNDNGSLPFAGLLKMERISEILDDLGYEFRDRVFSPWVTLWAFLSQVSSTDSSCEAAVTRVNAYLTLTDQEPCSPRASSYSTARQRLPEEFYSRLATDIGQDLDAMSPPQWLWKGRSVKIVDGTTTTMADTPANQSAYPQSSNQKAGLGFPVARITALFSMSTGAILDIEITGTKGKKTGEITAFRELWRSLKTNDIVVGDCLYDGYSDIAQLKDRGIDVVFGMSQSRSRDFRRGKSLGPGDHIVEWNRPKFDKNRMDRETWKALPETMLMREVTITIRHSHGQFRTITLVTTLRDAKRYPKDDILNLFQDRWNCELDLRCVKTLMGMKHINCKSPEMVRKEIWTYIMAYNLIRCHMALAADTYDVQPRELSFNNARHAIQTFTLAVIGVPSTMADRLYQQTLHTIACHRVGERPGRSEPRKLKRRKNKYPYLTVPRPKTQSQAA